MKPNSCLYRAVLKVCQYQFSVSPASDVFDKYNNGDGVATVIAASVINEACLPYRIRVKSIYCGQTAKQQIDHPELVKPPEFVPSPSIGFWHDHSEAAIGDEMLHGASVVMTLEKF